MKGKIKGKLFVNKFKFILNWIECITNNNNNNNIIIIINNNIITTQLNWFVYTIHNMWANLQTVSRTESFGNKSQLFIQTTHQFCYKVSDFSAILPIFPIHSNQIPFDNKWLDVFRHIIIAIVLTLKIISQTFSQVLVNWLQFYWIVFEDRI